MSVINTMLKDLDKRQQPHSLENMSTAPVQYQASSAPKMPWILLALVCFIFLIAVAYNWELLTKNSANEPVGGTNSGVQELVTRQALEDKALNTVTSTNSVVDAQKVTEDKRVPDTALEGSAKPEVTSKSQVVELVKTEKQLVKKAVVDEPAVEIVTTESKPSNEAELASSKPEPIEVVHSKPATPKVDNSSMAITEVRLSNAQLAEKRFQAATSAEDSGEQRDAIEYYREALGFSPKLHKARQRLAALFYGQGNLAQASDTLQEGSRLFPEQYEYLMLLARVQQAAGGYEQALASLKRIPDGTALNKQKWTQESTIAQKVKNYALAESSYRKLLQTEATMSRWWMGLAYALDAQQKYETAIEAYRQALFYRAVPQQGLSVQAVDYIENRLAQLGESQ
ncbi:tetratricopeptide repeat protein [Shewanella nanhaiensis]|uniref:MSHA biogenesis protein MshN n=1 Tax=Shewanella nanhaiensis TaxID=2864872 RepID=A0ABS7DZX1_9GAMM|nr:tetratricopeptide repeat protein [Shewanella nanhaiensis]MBW8182830.1 MSHA biogenesis protein MshN [Shewanella nanhaiensis]